MFLGGPELRPTFPLEYVGAPHNRYFLALLCERGHLPLAGCIDKLIFCHLKGRTGVSVLRHFCFNFIIPMILTFLGLWFVHNHFDDFRQEYYLSDIWGTQRIPTLAAVIVIVLAYSISNLIEQAIERRRSRKLAALATGMGMQFDSNLSWISFFPKKSKYDCLEQSAVPLLRRCSFKNIFIANSEPAIFGCKYGEGFGQSRYDVFRTVYRHKGEVNTNNEHKDETDWNIEIDDGFTIYYKDRYRATPNVVKEEYRETLNLHKTLRC